MIRWQQRFQNVYLVYFWWSVAIYPTFCGILLRSFSYYPIYRIFYPVLPMFLKRWCGQPSNFLLFQDTNAALGLPAPLDTRGRLVIWRDLVGARVHCCQRSWKPAWVISLLAKLFYSWAFLCLLVPRPHCSARPMLFGSRGRDRSESIKRFWENLVQALGKAPLTSYNNGETAVNGYSPAQFLILSVSCLCLAKLIFYVQYYQLADFTFFCFISPQA